MGQLNTLIQSYCANSLFEVALRYSSELVPFLVSCERRLILMHRLSPSNNTFSCCFNVSDIWSVLPFSKSVQWIGEFICRMGLTSGNREVLKETMYVVQSYVRLYGWNDSQIRLGEASLATALLSQFFASNPEESFESLSLDQKKQIAMLYYCQGTLLEAEHVSDAIHS